MEDSTSEEKRDHSETHEIGSLAVGRSHPDEVSSTDVPFPLLSGPTDGGLVAWSQVFAGHLTAFNSWGYINSFSLFQAYYTTTLNEAPSKISWIGSIQLFLTLFIGTFSGRALDAGYYRHVAFAGFALQVLGIFMTSLVKKYWQLLLAQGLCQGLGNGLVFPPTVALVSTYFVKKRALAVACMTCGTATGGIVFPVIARQLLDKVGFAWTIRVMGFIMLANSILVLALARARPSARSTGPLIDLAAFADPWYSFFGLGLLLACFGLYFAYYYITPFAQTIIHASSPTSLDLLLVTNAMGIPGRVAPAWIADRFLGPLNTLIVIVALSGILTYGWAAVDSLPGTWTFAVLYGFFGAGIQSMFPPALADSRKEMQGIGVRMGMVFSVMSVGSLCGPPVAGALVERDGGRYLFAQVFGGSVMVCGALVLVVPRVLSVGWGVWRKV